MQKTNSAIIAETLESLQSGLIDFLKPKLSLPDPDWKEVVEPSIHPAFLPILRRKIKEGAQPPRYSRPGLASQAHHLQLETLFRRSRTPGQELLFRNSGHPQQDRPPGNSGSCQRRRSPGA